MVPHRDSGGKLGLGITAIAGGVWGALLARVLVELWPLWFTRRYVLSAIWTLGGALSAPFLLSITGRSSGKSAIALTWPLLLSAGYLLQPRAAPLWGVGVLLAGLGGVVWLTVGQDLLGVPRCEWSWDVLALCAPLALYVATLAPSVLPGDSGEFQFVAPMLGIPHPTGYPLYLILGKLFSTLPFGSVAYRLNLLSAVAAAGATWAVYRAGRALRLGRSAALFGAALLAVSEAFWSQATIAEKYALNAFFVALTLWLGLRWRAERLSGRSGGGWLAVWALCYGLSLAHHRTMLLYAPVYVGLLWVTDRSCLTQPSTWRSLALVLVPLLLYLLLPIFDALDPPYAYIRINSLRAFLDLVLARTYQSGLFRGGWIGLPKRLGEFAGLLVRQFSLPGLVLSCAGCGMLVRHKKRVGWVLLAGIAVQVFFALNYYVPNTPVYYMPAYVWLSVCAAAAVGAVLRAIGRLDMGGRVAPHLSWAWVLIGAALPLALCDARWTGMDRRRAYASLAFDHTFGQMALRALEDDALVVSDWLPATVLWYGQWIEGLAPSAHVAVVDSLEWQWKDAVERALSTGRPVYLSRPVMAAGDEYPLTSAGPLVKVISEPALVAPPMSVPLGVELGDEMRLLGANWTVVAPGPEGAAYEPSNAFIDGGSTLYVTLYWQAIGRPAGDYAVSVRLVDAQGRTHLARRNRHPVRGTYPTSRWQPGEVVADTYTLVLPPHLPSGAYELLATIGPPFAETGLQDQKGSDLILLSTFNLRKPLRWSHASPDVSVRKRSLDDLMLMGYTVPREVTPGERISLALHWLVFDGARVDDLPALALVRSDETTRVVRATIDTPGDWRKGALVVQEYAFSVPEDVVRLEVRRRGWHYRLPIRVGAAQSPVANFGDQIRLRNYMYQSQSLSAGDVVRLTLEWEAVKAVSEPYKVFVHVLGKDGLPVSQQDNEPVNGTYPTTRWQRGERIHDPYAFALPDTLEPGTYQVEVGLYRVSDFGRLPVLDENQNVVDDKVFLAPLVVE